MKNENLDENIRDIILRKTENAGFKARFESGEEKKENAIPTEASKASELSVSKQIKIMNNDSIVDYSNDLRSDPGESFYQENVENFNKLEHEKNLERNLELAREPQEKDLFKISMKKVPVAIPVTNYNNNPVPIPIKQGMGIGGTVGITQNYGNSNQYIQPGKTGISGYNNVQLNQNSNQINVNNINPQQLNNNQINVNINKGPSIGIGDTLKQNINISPIVNVNTKGIGATVINNPRSPQGSPFGSPQMPPSDNNVNQVNNREMTRIDLFK